MKRIFFYSAVVAMCAVTLTSCKSRESAYKQAYERAKAAEAQQAAQTTTVTTTQPVVRVQETPQPTTTVTTQPTTTTVVVTPQDNSDVRTIQGGVTVISGDALRTYSVVVGSFVTQSNAEDLCSRLRQRGYASRVLKTNETINGHTGWYRVIASSYDDKSSAAQSRDGLKSEFAGAWLLYSK